MHSLPCNWKFVQLVSGTLSKYQRYYGTPRSGIFVKESIASRAYKKNEKEKERKRRGEKETAIPAVFKRGYRTENANETMRRETEGKRSRGRRRRHVGKETSPGKKEGTGIPWPIYHKLRGLWRESSRILPEEAREMRTAVPRATG